MYIRTHCHCYCHCYYDEVQRIGYTDPDGDLSEWAIEDGNLIWYMNGQIFKRHGDDSGVVRQLIYKPPAQVNDQYGVGHDLPLAVIAKLKAMADSVGVKNNIPSDVAKAACMHV